MTPGPKKSDARPMATRTCPGFSGGQELCGHRRPGPALFRGGGQGEVLGHRFAAGRAIAVEVLHGHQEGVGAFGCPQHVPLQRREQFRPLRVGGVQALVDDGCALGRVGGGFGVGGVRRPPVDALGQRRWAVARHRPDCGTGCGQPGGQGEAYLPGAEDDVQRLFSHLPASRMWASAPGGREGRGRGRARVALGRGSGTCVLLPFVLLLIFGPACFGVGGVANAACFGRMPLSRSDRGPEPEPSTGPRHGALAARYTVLGPKHRKLLAVCPARSPSAVGQCRRRFLASSWPMDSSDPSSGMRSHPAA